MTLFVVGIAVVTGRADEMDARRLSDRPQLRRSPAETDRRHLDDRLQPASGSVADLFDRLAEVI